jgi:eukaryotic-like serine/threonine-protein kinase
VFVARLPERIGKYEIVRVLGKGGMGTVYLGRDADLDRAVAIKVLRNSVSDDELLQRFLREARAAANLRHENIITIYEVGEHDRQPFMAMEYVDGPSLGQVITAREPLPLGRRLSYIEQVCAGLHHAHREGIVHRDIKPPNLMVDRGDLIRIVDFGIARVEGSGMTLDGTLIGSLNYMSPEQMLGRPVDLRSDIFAVGAVAYELLSYQQAFPGTLDDGLLHRLPSEPPPALSSLCPGLPPEIERLVMRALAKRPDDRFSDLDQMRVALREVRRGVDPDQQLESLSTPTLVRPSDARSTPSPSSSAGRPRTQTTIVITGGQMAAAVGVIVAAGIGGLLWLAPPGNRAPAVSPVAAPAAPVTVAAPASARTPAPAVAPAPVASRPVADPIPTRPHATESAPPIAPVATSVERAPVERTPIARTPTAPPPSPAATPVAPVVPQPPAVAPIAASPATAVEPVAPRANASAASPVAAPPVAAPPVAAAPAAPAPTAVPGPLERERPGILQALTRYQSAYRERNVKSLVAVYPGLPRESRQALERAFGRDCRDYDVTFGNVQLALNADDPTYATVTVRSVYTCQPKTAQAAQPQAVQDVFVLRKLGDGWLIDSVGTMDAGRR